MTIGDLGNFKSLKIEKTSTPFSSLYILGYDTSGNSTVIYSKSYGTSTGTISNQTFDITNYVKVFIDISRYSASGNAVGQIDNITIY